MWYSETLGVIKTPRTITKDGIRYPREIFRSSSKAELADLGITPARVVTPDQRYHNTGAETLTLVDGETVISYATTDRDVDQLKTSMKSKVKDRASSTLAQSDWMQHREAEGGTAMPADWKTYRANVRVKSNIKESEVDALADLDAVKAYDEAGGVGGDWPNDPDYVEPVEEEE
jgi:hypothetical protein